MDTSGFDRRSDLAAIFAQALVILYASASALRPLRELCGTMADDAGYYVAIARNFVQGYGWTFDRLHPTSGFQPLWEYVLVALCALVRGSLISQLRTIVLLETAMLGVAGWLLWRTMRQALGARLAALGSVLFGTLIFGPSRDGMESSLFLLLAATLVAASQAGPRAMFGTFGRQALSGVLLAALMLTRLDNVFWCGTFLLAAAFSEWGGTEPTRGRKFGAAVTAGIFAALPVAAYLVYNRAAFGHELPISAVLKSTFPRLGWYSSNIMITRLEGLLFLLGAALAAWVLLERFGRRDRELSWFWRAGLPAYAAAVLLHDLNTMLFLRWGVHGWHFVLSHVLVCMLAPVVLQRAVTLLPRTTQAPAFAVAITALLVVWVPLTVLRNWREGPRSSWCLDAFDLARWTNTNLPKHAILAMSDCGIVGLYGDRRVVNLDGLVNDFAFQEALRQGRLTSYLRDSGVQYLATFASPADSSAAGRDASVWSHQYDVSGGTIHLRHDDLLWNGVPASNRRRSAKVVLYRYRPEIQAYPPLSSSARTAAVGAVATP